LKRRSQKRKDLRPSLRITHNTLRDAQVPAI
jgi:hypothetical protein